MHPLVSLRNASLSVCRARSTAPLFCTRARIVTPWTTERDNATLHSRPQNRNALHQLQAQRWAHSGASSTRDVTHATALVYSSYGKPAEVLKVLRHTLEPPTEDSVQVQFLASPINPADINQVEGVYPLKPAMTTQLYGLNKQGSEQDQPPVAVGGNEGVAKVIKVGANAKAYYDVGDLVVMGSAGLGTWRSHGNFLANELTKVRTAEAQRVQTSKIDNVQLATITVNPCTAYRMLRDFKTLSPGDFIIQNGANSGVGEAVIQMAKALGVHTINIIRSRPGHELVAERLKALGATHILLDEQLGRLETKEQVKSWTGSKGQIKLGFNCVGGKPTTEMARLLSKNGHLVTYGAMSRQPLILPASLQIFKNVHASGFWLTAWNDEQKPEARRAMIDEVLETMEQGEFKGIHCTKSQWSTGDTQLESRLLEAVQRATSSGFGKQVFVME